MSGPLLRPPFYVTGVLLNPFNMLIEFLDTQNLCRHQNYDSSPYIKEDIGGFYALGASNSTYLVQFATIFRSQIYPEEFLKFTGMLSILESNILQRIFSVLVSKWPPQAVVRMYTE